MDRFVGCELDFRALSRFWTRQRTGQFQAAANPAASMRQGDIVVNDRHIDVQQSLRPVD